MSANEYLRMAANVALPSDDTDFRSFWLGCVGIRNDGIIVSAKNGAIKHYKCIENYQLVPASHAEGRVLRKLGREGILFVARVSKRDRGLACAMPCGMCSIRIKSFKVKRVYYTINNIQYGVWDPRKDIHTINYL